ncbi:type IX secretion system protein PorQ [Mangrovibacterium lignilyticum]|uniref:type IX secretion system protein PorQ n=1 Tax=Mangrovibacterium lignilyticum TaxID=2668052 RepID=UPI0013D48B30|nr:type IX secretion system protein PorQ [Mangrovibacterium lignilyticum]
MKFRKLLVLPLLILSVHVVAQIGGESTYEFLNLTNSAKMAALGGNQIALNDHSDLNVAYNNPALLNDEMAGSVLMNYVNYIADVNYGYAAFALKTEKIGPLTFGIHYINYGDFIKADETGQKEGSFRAAEYALLASWSKQVKAVKLGITLKPILSSFESYKSVGIAFDLGAAYTSDNELSTIGLVVRNMGTQITTYYENGDRESIPLDIQLGGSQRLAHAPFRLSATLQHLQRWRLAQDEEVDNGFETTIEKDSFTKAFMRHVVLGVELLPSENFHIRAGYNFQRRQELMFNDKKSTVGFSWGFGFQIKRFRIDYGSARYHLSSSSNHFSVAFRLNNSLR